MSQLKVGIWVPCVIYPDLGIHEIQPVPFFLPLTTRALRFPLY